MLQVFIAFATWLTKLLTPSGNTWRDALLAGVLIAVASVVGTWANLFATYLYLVTWRLLRSGADWNRRFQIDLFPVSALDKTGSTVKRVGYLLVRFGRDGYLRDLASEQEKIIGKALHRQKFIWPKPSGMRLFFWRQPPGPLGVLKMDVPIHGQLGTQFKCFVDAQEPIEQNVPKIMSALRRTRCVLPRSVERSDGLYRGRIYFLLRNVYVEVVDSKVRNNYIFPV
jgi:hypothetical protein